MGRAAGCRRWLESGRGSQGIGAAGTTRPSRASSPPGARQVRRTTRPARRRRPPGPGAAVDPVTEDERADQVVPPAGRADLDDVDAELAVLVGHRLELGRRLDPAGVLPELVAVGVAQLDQRARAGRPGSPARWPRRGAWPPAAGRGRRRRRRSGVTGPPREQRLERRPARQRVVDDRPLGPHTGEAYDGAGSRTRPRCGACAPRGRRCLSSGCIGAIHRADAPVPARQLRVERQHPRGGTAVSKRTGVLELAVLGLLHESPMHGYELRKRLNAMLGTFRAFSYGSLYPCLKDLLAQAAGSPRRPSEPGGRRRAVAPRSSTGSPPRARSTSQDLLAEAGPAAWDDESFGVHFAFFGQTDADVRLRILEGRRSRLEERLDGRPHVARPHPRAGRQLHPRAAAARPRVRRARGPLAQRADRRASAQRAPSATDGRHRTSTDQRRDPARTQQLREQGVTGMGSVRVAIVGVGNCASSLVQGVEYYKDADPHGTRPRAHARRSSATYHVRDVEFVAAFDVDAKKVGQDLVRGDRREREQHDQDRDVPPTGVTVQRGHTLDGLGKYYRETITESDDEPVDVVAALRETPGRRPGLLPAGRLRGGREVLRAVRDRRRRRLRQRAAGLHRRHQGVGRQVHRRRRPDRR